MLPLKDYGKDDLDYGDDLEIPLSGGVFVTRRILSAQGVEDELQQQRDNLFHTRCLVQ